MLATLATPANSVNHDALVLGRTEEQDVENRQKVTPMIRVKYQRAQLESPLSNLPEDINPLILKFAKQSVFRLGLTCKHWNLAVREFLAERPEGKKIMREKHEAAFRKVHRTAVLDQFRNFYKNGSSFQKISVSDDGYNARTLLKDSETSTDVLCILPADKGTSMTNFAESALKSRNNKLTIIEIANPDDIRMEAVLKVLQAIPSSGLAALVIPSQLIASREAHQLWDAISNHSVVVHIECNGDTSSEVASQAVEMITLLAKKDTNVTSFALNACGVDELSRDQLSELLSTSTGMMELEINERKTSTGNVNNLAEALGARNAGSHSKLALYFSAHNLDEVITEQERSTLSSKGICFRESDQPWIVENDPLTGHSVDEYSGGKDDAKNGPAAEDSVDDDSSVVVSAPTSGDETWGSDFESSAEDSDVIVTGSSDDES